MFDKRKFTAAFILLLASVLAGASQSLKKTIPAQQNKEILSKDYKIAEKALNKAVFEKNKDTIRLGLKSPILEIRAKTVKEIGKLADETFVPNLIEALEENQGIIDGGSEIQVMQQELNKDIVSVLEKFDQLRVCF